ncbi:GNAT family N-acetyltransferase [Sphingomonas sp.]|uniref:GNAT family N-acetyltransferase n=1 Tax=Sphingomonas sp. TaxID=28214 RepID=UPI0038AA18BB
MIIRTAASKGDYQQVAALMRAFLDWHGERHAADRHIVDSYFDPQAFAEELDNLPGEFAEPRGRLLVAEEHGRIAGCVALRDLGGDACEMKRMFVYREFHGRGIGQLLGRAIVGEAKAIGYRKMLLDTGPAQREAQALYRKLGFKDIEPYYELSVELRNWLVFMELDLTE